MLRPQHRVPTWVAAIVVFLLIRLFGLATLAVYAEESRVSLESLLTKWDGQWMLAIATNGYDRLPPWFVDGQGVHSEATTYAFFPGYPVLVGVVSVVLPVTAAAFVVNVVAGAAAAAGIARLGARYAAPRGADPDLVGLLAAALFAAAPMGIVLSMTYTEASFCALAAWGLVAVLERRWLLAGSLALVAGLFRPTSVALIGVVMLAALLAGRDGARGIDRKTGDGARGIDQKRGDGPRRFAAVVLAPLGWLGYILWVGHRLGSPFAWFEVQTKGWNTTFDFGAATLRFLRDTLLHDQTVAALVAVVSIVLATILFAVLIADRLPWSSGEWPILLYGAVALATVLLSDGLMISRPRLLLPAFVLLLPVAVGLSRLRPGTQVAVVTGTTAVSCYIGAHMLAVFPYAM